MVLVRTGLSWIWAPPAELSFLRILQRPVDLWGRLSNPPDTLELDPDQGFLTDSAAGERAPKAPNRSPSPPGTRYPNNRGQHSNPGSGTLRGGVDGVDSPAASEGARRSTKPVQRRLSPYETSCIAAEYLLGRSLEELARQFGVHRRTVADHLERLGVARRVNLPKLTPPDIERAASRYQAGDSLATVGKALNVDPSTIQRALRRAGVTIRARPGY